MDEDNNIKGKQHKTNIIHIRNLPEEYHEELWCLRRYINAKNWVEVVKWMIDKYIEELKIEREGEKQILGRKMNKVKLGDWKLQFVEYGGIRERADLCREINKIGGRVYRITRKRIYFEIMED
jgi:hypothetical protein